MYAVETYVAVRQFVFVEGKSRREAARVFGLSRDTIDKMCRFSAPPGYQRTKEPAKPKLGRLIPVIDAILEADRTAPPKQRHTAKRIFVRLKAEHGFTGGYTVVKDYVRIAKARLRETFVPLAHPPGHAQVDFGEAIGIIGGVRQKMHVFYMDLPHSDAPFMKAYPAETTEAFLDGHVSAFAFFGKVPQSILYDNTKIAVARICGDGRRERTRAFTGLVSHHLFRDRFGRPGKGNDKGKVESLVENGRRRFLTPMPQAASYEALNARLADDCRGRQAETAGRHTATIGARLVADLAAFRDLPAVALEPCDKRTARVSSTSLVRYRDTDYSVPTTYGFREVLVKGFVDEVVIFAGTVEIARHRRSYERGGFVFDPLHYLALIERKPGALDQAAPLQDWDLNKMLVLELARSEYILRRENIIALGNSGTGKSHVALALGLAACQRGLAVGFTTAVSLVNQLLESRDEKRLLRLQTQLAGYKLLIVDELGYVPLSPTGAELLFEVFSQRYERGSTIVTSNLPFEDWTSVFGSERLTGALLDRLTHHVHILEMNGDSYRLKQSKGRKRRQTGEAGTELAVDPETGEISQP